MVPWSPGCLIPSRGGPPVADVIMPKRGDAMTEGKVLNWRKRPGDSIAKGEAIAEIETDKVNVDIEAEEGGVLLEILVDEGKSAPVGASIAVIGAPGQKVQPRPLSAPAAQPAPAPAPVAAGPPPPTPPAAAAGPPAAPDPVKISPPARELAAEHPLDLAPLPGTRPGRRLTKENIQT